MCWEGKKNKKIAWRPIIVFKFIDENNKPICQMGEPYEVGKIYKTKMSVGRSYRNDLCTVYAGYHSFNGNNKLVPMPELRQNVVVSTCKGHSLMLPMNHPYSLAICKIPRFSHYYYNKILGTYVSNKIIITKIIRNYNLKTPFKNVLV